MTPTDFASVYQRLLDNPGDVPTMLVLADVLEDSGESDVAAAYRWAAARGRWPLVRNDRRTGEQVYDWDGEGRKPPVPEESRLPRTLYDAIRLRVPDRVYGDVHEAFVLLARGLAVLGDTP